jgi:hypothetical protein
MAVLVSGGQCPVDVDGVVGCGTKDGGLFFLRYFPFWYLFQAAGVIIAFVRGMGK